MEDREMKLSSDNSNLRLTGVTAWDPKGYQPLKVVHVAHTTHSKIQT